MAGTAASRSSWSAREPGLVSLLAHAARLFRRARRRPVLVMGVSLVAAAAVGAYLKVTPQWHHATVILRASEPTLVDLGRRGWTNRELRDEVTNLVFSDENLLAAFRKATGEDKPLNAREVAADVLDWTTVEVRQNHALALLTPEERMPSAHVAITVRCPWPIALPLARALAATIIESRGSVRRADLRALLLVERARLDEALTEAEVLEGRVKTLTVKATLDSPILRAVLKDLREIRANVSYWRTAVAARERELNGAGGASALDFAVADERYRQPMPRNVRSLVASAAALFGGLPIWVLVIGAFDRRVYYPEDLRHLGLVPLGHIRHAGSLPPIPEKPGQRPTTGSLDS